MGRKGALLLNNLLAFLAAALMALAKYVNVYYMITAGRFVIGLCCGTFYYFNYEVLYVCIGLSSGLVPMYLTEVSPINLRGTLGSIHQLMVTIAILFSQVVGLPQLLGTESRWPLIFGMLCA